MKTLRLFILTVCFACAAAAFAAAQDTPAAPQPQAAAQAGVMPQAALKGSVPKVKIAAPFTLTFSVPLPEGATAQDLEGAKEMFNNTDFAVLGTSSVQVGNTAEYTFELMAFNIGQTTFTAGWTVKDHMGKIKAADVKLDIAKKATGIRKADIVDIHKPYRPFNVWLLVKIIVGLLFALILVELYIYFIYKKHWKDLVKPAPQLKPKDIRPLEVIAKERIQKVIQSGLWEKEEYKQYYTQLTDILRWYIEMRYNIDAAEQTSYELIRSLKKSGLHELFAPVKQFLTSADLVKFAKQVPLILDRDEDLNLLALILEKGVPAPARQEEGGAK